MHPLPIGTKIRVFAMNGTGLKVDSIFTVNEVEPYMEDDYIGCDYYEVADEYGFRLVVDSKWFDKGLVGVIE